MFGVGAHRKGLAWFRAATELTICGRARIAAQSTRWNLRSFKYLLNKGYLPITEAMGFWKLLRWGGSAPSSCDQFGKGLRGDFLNSSINLRPPHIAEARTRSAHPSLVFLHTIRLESRTRYSATHSKDNSESVRAMVRSPPMTECVHIIPGAHILL